jgi:hypothetical protein
MAKTYEEIETEINALSCDPKVSVAQIKTIYQDLLDFAVQEKELIGGFVISDIDDNAVTVNSPFGIVSSVAQELGAGFFCKIRVNLNQSIVGDYQPFISFEWFNNGNTDPNVFVPMIFEKNTNNFAIGFNEGSTAVQNLKVYIRIIKIN